MGHTLHLLFTISLISDLHLSKSTSMTPDHTTFDDFSISATRDSAQSFVVMTASLLGEGVSSSLVQSRDCVSTDSFTSSFDYTEATAFTHLLPEEKTTTIKSREITTFVNNQSETLESVQYFTEPNTTFPANINVTESTDIVTPDDISVYISSSFSNTIDIKPSTPTSPLFTSTTAIDVSDLTNQQMHASTNSVAKSEEMFTPNITLSPLIIISEGSVNYTNFQTDMYTQVSAVPSSSAIIFAEVTRPAQHLKTSPDIVTNVTQNTITSEMNINRSIISGNTFQEENSSQTYKELANSLRLSLIYSTQEITSNYMSTETSKSRYSVIEQLAEIRNLAETKAFSSIEPTITIYNSRESTISIYHSREPIISNVNLIEPTISMYQSEEETKIFNSSAPTLNSYTPTVLSASVYSLISPTVSSYGSIEPTTSDHNSTESIITEPHLSTLTSQQNLALTPSVSKISDFSAFIQPSAIQDMGTDIKESSTIGRDVYVTISQLTKGTSIQTIHTTPDVSTVTNAGHSTTISVRKVNENTDILDEIQTVTTTKTAHTSFYISRISNTVTPSSKTTVRPAADGVQVKVEFYFNGNCKRLEDKFSKPDQLNRQLHDMMNTDDNHGYGIELSEVKCTKNSFIVNITYKNKLLMMRRLDELFSPHSKAPAIHVCELKYKCKIHLKRYETVSMKSVEKLTISDKTILAIVLAVFGILAIIGMAVWIQKLCDWLRKTAKKDKLWNIYFVENKSLDDFTESDIEMTDTPFCETDDKFSETSFCRIKDDVTEDSFTGKLIELHGESESMTNLPPPYDIAVRNSVLLCRLENGVSFSSADSPEEYQSTGSINTVENLPMSQEFLV